LPVEPLILKTLANSARLWRICRQISMSRQWNIHLRFCRRTYAQYQLLNFDIRGNGKIHDARLRCTWGKANIRPDIGWRYNLSSGQNQPGDIGIQQINGGGA